jgi:pyruvate formate lyase activating enzyme
MPEDAVGQTSLAAKSPYELRVNLGASVPETDVRTALATGEMGFVHSFTTGSAVDGPGVRVVVWTSGCMWRCQYCHNPDTWTITNGIPVTVSRAVEELRKYRSGLQIMSGGLTVSGGEPLMQHKFVLRFLAAAKGMGLHTTIETNGYFADRLTDQDLDSIDLVMLGIKTWGNARHRQLTGMDLEPTLAFARRLARLRKKVWIRFVLVPDLTDDPDDLANIAQFVSELGNVERVEVLPFHQLGKFKWHQLGLQYTLENAQAPTAEQCEQACAIFRERGLKAY